MQFADYSFNLLSITPNKSLITHYLLPTHYHYLLAILNQFPNSFPTCAEWDATLQGGYLPVR